MDSINSINFGGEMQKTSKETVLVDCNLNKPCWKIVEEIIVTELSYCDDIVSLIDNYKVPISQTIWNVDPSPIFGNLLDIRAFEIDILNEMNLYMNDLISFCKIFTKFKSRFILIYGSYISNFANALSTLEECMKTLEFKSYIDNVNSKLNQKLPLQSYLLKPVQRILKYKIFLNNIVKELLKQSLPADTVSESEKTMDEVAITINAMKKSNEDYNTFLTYKKTVTNVNNFEFENTGTFVSSHGATCKNIPVELLILERYILLLEVASPNEKVTKIVGRISSLEIRTIKKKEKSILLIVNGKETVVKFNDQNSAKSVVQRIINQKKDICTRLKDPTTRITEISLPQVTIINSDFSNDSNDHISNDERIEFEATDIGTDYSVYGDLSKIYGIDQIYNDPQPNKIYGNIKDEIEARISLQLSKCPHHSIPSDICKEQQKDNIHQGARNITTLRLNSDDKLRKIKEIHKISKSANLPVNSSENSEVINQNRVPIKSLTSVIEELQASSKFKKDRLSHLPTNIISPKANPTNINQELLIKNITKLKNATDRNKKLPSKTIKQEKPTFQRNATLPTTLENDHRPILKKISHSMSFKLPEPHAKRFDDNKNMKENDELADQPKTLLKLQQNDLSAIISGLKKKNLTRF